MPLSAYLQGGPLEDAARVAIARETAAGMAYLHQNNVVHGNLKPGMRCGAGSWSWVERTMERQRVESAMCSCAKFLSFGLRCSFLQPTWPSTRQCMSR